MRTSKIKQQNYLISGSSKSVRMCYDLSCARVCVCYITYHIFPFIVLILFSSLLIRVNSFFSGCLSVKSHDDVHCVLSHCFVQDVPTQIHTDPNTQTHTTVRETNSCTAPLRYGVSKTETDRQRERERTRVRN